MTKIFADVSEKEITGTISMMFNETIDEYANCGGAGPAGLMASRDLARMGARTFSDSVFRGGRNFFSRY